MVSLPTAHLRLWIDCGVIAGPGTGSQGAQGGVGNGGVPSAQEVLNFIAYRHFQTVDPSRPEELNGFLEYLKEVRKVLFVDAQPGSLIITVECSSLEILDDLWEDYCTGHLNEVAQQFLVTEDVLNQFGLISVNLTTTVAEKEYRDCRDWILNHPGVHVRISHFMPSQIYT